MVNGNLPQFGGMADFFARLPLIEPVVGNAIPRRESDVRMYFVERESGSWVNCMADESHVPLNSLVRELTDLYDNPPSLLGKLFLLLGGVKAHSTPTTLREFDEHVPVYVDVLTHAGFRVRVLNEKDKDDDSVIIPISDRPLLRYQTYRVHATRKERMYTFGAGSGHGAAYALLYHHLKSNNLL